MVRCYFRPSKEEQNDDLNWLQWRRGILFHRNIKSVVHSTSVTHRGLAVVEGQSSKGRKRWSTSLAEVKVNSKRSTSTEMLVIVVGKVVVLQAVLRSYSLPVSEIQIPH